MLVCGTPLPGSVTTTINPQRNSNLHQIDHRTVGEHRPQPVIKYWSRTAAQSHKHVVNQSHNEHVKLCNNKACCIIG